MATYLGDTPLTKLYVGPASVTKLYQGATLILDPGGTPPPGVEAYDVVSGRAVVHAQSITDRTTAADGGAWVNETNPTNGQDGIKQIGGASSSSLANQPGEGPTLTVNFRFPAAGNYNLTIGYTGKTAAQNSVFAGWDGDPLAQILNSQTGEAQVFFEELLPVTVGGPGVRTLTISKRETQFFLYRLIVHDAPLGTDAEKLAYTESPKS